MNPPQAYMHSPSEPSSLLPPRTIPHNSMCIFTFLRKKQNKQKSLRTVKLNKQTKLKPTKETKKQIMFYGHNGIRCK